MDTILIVEDQKINREMLKNILGGYLFLEAEDGKEAIEIIDERKQEIALVLLDILMPQVDGFDVLKYMKRKNILTDVPVIIQTDHTEDVFEANALKMGAVDYIVKPYKPSVIKARVNRAIALNKKLHRISELEVDEITGLMSINSFFCRGTEWMEEYPELDFDLVAMDIDHFGMINDSKGMDGGNELLHILGDLIIEEMKNTKFLCSRVYADRFIFLFERKNGYIDILNERAKKVTEELSNLYTVSLKFGVYEIEDKTINLYKCCGRAFSAIHMIKKLYGTQYVYYNEHIHKQILFEEEINNEMFSALKERQFEIYIQPKYDTFSNTIAGGEALVRWNHPKLGLISPGAFIPVFEKNGFITELDKYVWEETVSILASWYHKGKKLVPVSVNLSRMDFDNIDVVEYLLMLIKKYNLEPELLHLEITESAYMEDSQKLIRVVKRLKENGFLIEMDDFGSGYSSLNMLAKLPIDILKLDMKFTQSIEDTVGASTVIEYTLGLAKWMNIPVVAEGVETQEQLDLLKRFECNYVQGFIFAKPIPHKEFYKLLISNEKETNAQGKQDQRLQIYKNENGYTMLIVEDLQLNRSVIRSYFQDSFTIVEAENGRVAMDYLNAGGTADIIILDIYMPEMDGYEMLAQLKASPRLKNIPVLAASSKHDNDEAKKVYGLGADVFVPKPFTAERIMEKVRVLMRAFDMVHNMTTWDLVDMAKNPLISGLYDTIFMIRISDKNIYILEDEKLVNTGKPYWDMIEKKYYEQYLKENRNSGKRYSYIQKNKHIVDLQHAVIDKEEMVICFIRDLTKLE